MLTLALGGILAIGLPRLARDEECSLKAATMDLLANRTKIYL